MNQKTTPITDAEAVDITAGLLFRELLDVATTSTDPEEQTIASARAAGRTVLDAVRDILGSERGRCVSLEALDLVLAKIHPGEASA